MGTVDPNKISNKSQSRPKNILTLSQSINTYFLNDYWLILGGAAYLSHFHEDDLPKNKTKSTEKSENYIKRYIDYHSNKTDTNEQKLREAESKFNKKSRKDSDLFTSIDRLILEKIDPFLNDPDWKVSSEDLVAPYIGQDEYKAFSGYTDHFAFNEKKNLAHIIEIKCPDKGIKQIPTMKNKCQLSGYMYAMYNSMLANPEKYPNLEETNFSGELCYVTDHYIGLNSADYYTCSFDMGTPEKFNRYYSIWEKNIIPLHKLYCILSQLPSYRRIELLEFHCYNIVRPYALYEYSTGTVKGNERIVKKKYNSVEMDKYFESKQKEFFDLAKKGMSSRIVNEIDNALEKIQNNPNYSKGYSRVDAQIFKVLNSEGKETDINSINLDADNLAVYRKLNFFNKWPEMKAIA